MHNGDFNPLEHKMDIMTKYETLESEKINIGLKMENTVLAFLLVAVVSIVGIIGIATYLRDRNKEN